MSQSTIHPQAIVAEGAQIGKNVTIEPFAVIGKDVKIGDGSIIKSHAVIEGNTTIGKNTKIFPGACIGGDPQALKYQGEISFIEIGDNCVIREYVTINSSLGKDSLCHVGNNCMIMAYCHIAHNSWIGNHVILSNNAALAGHVRIEDHAIIGGYTAIHQFVRIGQYVMVGGFNPIGKDIPPYTIGRGFPFRFGGLNLVGLKRHNFSLETRQELSKAYRLVYRSGLKLDEALHKIKTELKQLPEIKNWIEFCENSKRGLSGLGESHDEEYIEEEALETSAS